MRKLLTLFVCSVLLVATGLLIGCAGTGKKAAYKTIKTIAQSVDIAMQAFTDAEVAGQVSSGDVAKVRALHARYQVALKKAIVAAKFNYEDAAPAEVSALAAEIASTVAFLIKTGP